MFALIASSVLALAAFDLDSPTNIKEKATGEGFTFYKLSFSGHTYIYFRYHWNNAGNAFMHDPSCMCVEITKDKIAETVRLVTKAKEEK